MTNKKAIEWLKLELEKGVSWDDTSESTKNIREQAEVEIKEALEMAIKALEQQPCDDFISRQAVLDLVVNNHIKLNELNVVMYAPLCKDIKSLPSATAKEKMGHGLE